MTKLICLSVPRYFLFIFSLSLILGFGAPNVWALSLDKAPGAVDSIKAGYKDIGELQGGAKSVIPVGKVPASVDSIKTAYKDIGKDIGVLQEAANPSAPIETQPVVTSEDTIKPVAQDIVVASLSNAQLETIQQDVMKYTATVPTVTFEYLNLVSSSLSSRLGGVRSQSVAAISSGDEGYIRRGVWIEGVWSATKQKQYKNLLPFKNNQQGGVVGFDTELSDRLVIGAAYTLGLSKTKFNGSANNRQRAILHIGALYGEYTFPSNITINSYLEYGRAFIKNKSELGVMSINGKSKGDIMRAKLEGYYQFNAGELIVKPIAGIRYDYYMMKSYTQQSSVVSINVPKTQGKRVEVEAGVALGKDIMLKKVTIKPEIYVGMERAIMSSNSSRIISINNAATQTQIMGITPQKVSGVYDTIYTIGGSVKIQSRSRFEIGAGYDYSFKKKFANHAVYLSNKISF